MIELLGDTKKYVIRLLSIFAQNVLRIGIEKVITSDILAFRRVQRDALVGWGGGGG
jgi:hypothetical protein